MTSEQRSRSLTKVGAAAAIALGLAAGSYGLATAASGSDSSSSSAASSNQYAAALSTPAAAPSAQNPWGGQRSDETLLTGDTAAKVKGAALAKVASEIIVRVETDADGTAAYEAHMTKSDGTPVTVYVDKEFNVVSVESR